MNCVLRNSEIGLLRYNISDAATVLNDEEQIWLFEGAWFRNCNICYKVLRNMCARNKGNYKLSNF
jgi:hypothetical protein